MRHRIYGDLTAILKRWMRWPPARWDKLATEGIDSGELDIFARKLCEAAVDAVRRAAYCNARELGDTHEIAVGVSNIAVASVENTFGSAYPKSQPLPF